MTLFNYVHYITLSVIFVFFLIGVYSSLKQKKASLKFSMLFSTFLVTALVAVISIFVVDKYTKHVKLVKIKNKRILGIEKIIYYGVVKNVGKFSVGKVTLEIKLVNRGHATGRVKGGNFYKSTGFFDMFSEGLGIDKAKPQTITKEFVVAKNLDPGETAHFRVYFPFPPYFSSVADFKKIRAH